MPKNEKAKTKSAHKRQLVVYSLIFSVLIIAIVGSLLLGAKSEKNEKKTKPPVTCLQIENNCFELEVADTEAEHIKGLSERNGLPQNQGMLFVFRQTEEQCFWMKDMRFNLDIIWTDEHKRITKIEKSVSPDTYPDSFCADNTKYVLEFNRGFADKYGLKTGTKLQF